MQLNFVALGLGLDGCQHYYITISDSGEWMRRDKIPTQRVHAACRVVTRGPCCTKSFAKFNVNRES